MSGNRAFKQIANNLSGSDYIKNKKSKAIYKTYRGSPDKINKNVRIEENSLASAESYEMLNLITNGKDITYTMSGGEGTAAMSLQNLQSSNDTWKGSLLKSKDGEVNLVAQDFNESLFLQSIYGTNGTVGCVNEDSSQLSFTCCGTAGTSTSPTPVPLPTLTGVNFASMTIYLGESKETIIKLSDVFIGASYYEFTYDDPTETGITASVSPDNKVDVTAPAYIPAYLPSQNIISITITPKNKCNVSGPSVSLAVLATEPLPTPTGVEIDSPIYVTPGSSAYSTVKLSEVFNNAASYVYNADDNQITISTEPDTRIKVEWASGPVIGDNVIITVDVTAGNSSGSGETTKSFTVKPALPSVTSTNAIRDEKTSTTDNKEYVLFIFADIHGGALQGTLSVDFSGTSNNTLNSNVLLVAGGAAGGTMETGLYDGGSVTNGSGGGGAGGYASGQMAITNTNTNTNSSTTTYTIDVGEGGIGLTDGTYSHNGNGNPGKDTSISIDGASVIKVIGGGSGLYTHTPGGFGSGGSTGGNSHEVPRKPVETALTTITGYGHFGGDLEFGNLGKPALQHGGGGGGGAGSAGKSGPETDSASPTHGGNGGNGKEWEINNILYGGGGGGSGAEGHETTVGLGGSGGGGTSNSTNTWDQNGTNGRGGGGAGGWYNKTWRGDGGSGVCIIAFEKGTITYQI